MLDIAIVAAIAGASIALAGVLVQSLLAHHFSKSQSLMEARRIVYAKLLSASMSEDSYPGFFSIEMYESVEKYNEKVRVWRANRRILKGIAAEALFVSGNEELKTKLRTFIESNEPDLNLTDLEDLMRKEIDL